MLRSLSSHHYITGALLVCATFTLACTQNSAEPCDMAIAVRVQSSRETLRVGDTTTLRASATTCVGRETPTYTWRYSVNDSSIARINASTGLLTSRTAGTVTVQAESDAVLTRGFLNITVTP